MNKKVIFCNVLAFFLAMSIVSASTYSIEFTQINQNVVVKENIDNSYLGSYVDQSLIDKSGDKLYFVKKIIFNQSFSEAKIKLILDKGIILSDSLAFPEGYTIETDGKTISLTWDFKNIFLGQSFAMFVILEDTTASLSWIYLITGIIICTIGFLIYRLRNQTKRNSNKKRKNSKKRENANVVYDYLLDTEKKVIEELKKADRHELWQKQIQNATGFSKAKTSRLVKNLESRNLVTKIPFGNTNKVRLK